jgi:triacylglycerol lipase
MLGGGMKLGRLKWSSFRQIDEAIETAGYPVFASAVHPTAGIEKRARQLRRWMLGILPKLGEPVILIAHSMGGLDARFMITHLGMARHVAALATISTPHRGSPLADWFIQNFSRRWPGLQIAQKLGLEVGAAADLTTEQCARFNRETPDVAGVRYYSVSASRPRKLMPAFALHSHKIIYKAEGPNDGLVSVRSAKWGTYLGNWSADHWQSINRRYSWRGIHKPVNIVQKYVALLETVAGDV